MYYDELEKRNLQERDAYSWEVVEGMPRYRRYKGCMTAVDLITMLDNHHDISKYKCDDLGIYFECVDWVARNDPKALTHIMTTIVKPVTSIVKEKFMEGLERFKFYEACAIVKENLDTFPIPKERTLQRKKDKAFKEINGLVSRVEEVSDILYQFKTKHNDKIEKPELRERLGSLLNIEDYSSREVLERSMDAMEWLRANFPDDLKMKFQDEICVEIKDLFKELLSENEKYKLCMFIDEIIKTNNLKGYYEIPPLSQLQKNSLIDELDFLEEEED